MDQQKLTLCETEISEWKEKVRVSLWVFLKILDLVSNEYPDPRLIICRISANTFLRDYLFLKVQNVEIFI